MGKVWGLLVGVEAVVIIMKSIGGKAVVIVPGSRIVKLVGDTLVLPGSFLVSMNISGMIVAVLILVGWVIVWSRVCGSEWLNNETFKPAVWIEGKLFVG